MVLLENGIYTAKGYQISEEAHVELLSKLGIDVLKLIENEDYQERNFKVGDILYTLTFNEDTKSVNVKTVSEVPKLQPPKTSDIIKATKIQVMNIVSSVGSMENNSLYCIVSDTLNIKTDLNGSTEAKATANKGDWVAKGSSGELWVIKHDDIKDLYNIDGSVATPKTVKSFYLINHPEELSWENSTGTMIIPSNKDYYLMSTEEDLLKLNWDKISPMDVKTFGETYNIVEN